MTTLEELRQQVEKLQETANALPQWKKTVLHRAHQTEVELGFIRKTEMKTAEPPKSTPPVQAQ